MAGGRQPRRSRRPERSSAGEHDGSTSNRVLRRGPATPCPPPPPTLHRRLSNRSQRLIRTENGPERVSRLTGDPTLPTPTPRVPCQQIVGQLKIVRAKHQQIPPPRPTRQSVVPRPTNPPPDRPLTASEGIPSSSAPDVLPGPAALELPGPPALDWSSSAQNRDRLGGSHCGYELNEDRGQSKTCGRQAQTRDIELVVGRPVHVLLQLIPHAAEDALSTDGRPDDRAAAEESQNRIMSGDTF